MDNKRLWGIALLLIFLAFPAFASTVSLLLVETGLSEEFNRTEQTIVWEDGLLSAFFDAGHIVTNSPILRMERRPAQDITGPVKNDLDDALLGGADYFILGYLEYRVIEENAIPFRMAVKIYTTDSQKLVYENNYPAGSGKSNNEEYQYALNAGRSIIPHIKDR